MILYLEKPWHWVMTLSDSILTVSKRQGRREGERNLKAAIACEGQEIDLFAIIDGAVFP